MPASQQLLEAANCTIKRHDRDVEEVVGVVQKTLTGVYKMEHEDSTVNAVEERLTLESFH